jgi:DNA-binding CsgD family transcriptional regulator
VELIGRSSELELLTGLLAQAADGISAALVVRGEPGIGKTALLDAVAARVQADGLKVARVTGVESEAPLGYAALHRLLLLFPGLIEQLPAPQREALQSTFGLLAGPPPDRFLTALGVLTLLADAASEAPLLCIIDDAQWLDPESAVVLGFVARRLQAEGVVMLFAARELTEVTSALQDLPELVIGVLDAAAATLLSSIAKSRLSPEVESRLVAEGGGNPLALVELAAELTPAQLAGTATLPDPLPAAGSLQQMFSRRLGRLSPGTRLLLAVAAAEPTASDILLLRVAERLGVDPALAESQFTGLAELGPTVTVRHPVVRSVAYHSVPAAQRRLVHQVLAELTDSREQPDRLAWHLAMGASGPDEAVAAQLAQAAERAMDRGGYAATATFLARAAELSVDDELRTDRLLAASEAALTAGRPEQTRALLDQAQSGATSDRQVAAALRLGGEVSFARGQTGDAARQLLAAAKRLMPVDAGLGRRTLLSALTAAEYTREDAIEEVRAFAKDVFETPPDLEEPSSVADCFLFGFLHRLSGAPEEAAPLLRAAMDNLRDPETPDAVRMSVPIVVGALAGTELLDEDLLTEVLDAYVRFARRAGALWVLPPALASLAIALTRQGRFDEAQEACAEARALGEATGATGRPLAWSAELNLLCWRGREAEAREHGVRISAEEERRGGDVRAYRDQAPMYLAVLELGLGRYRPAYSHALPIYRADRFGFGTLVLPEIIEAAARCGELLVAHEALNRLQERAEASGARWALGRLACCQALLAEDAEPLYRRAIELLRPRPLLTDLARTHLLFGEWLRRQRRRREARLQLTRAYELFSNMGAEAFAQRAQVELEATGETARKRSVEAAQTLTPQEAQVARLVANGGTNRDVAAQLFISPATVDYHLRKVYQKLEITSRTQLARTMLAGI